MLRCDECRFWLPNAEDVETGRCQLNPDKTATTRGEQTENRFCDGVDVESRQ